MQRDSILITALFLILALLAPGPARAAAPYNQWNGDGPLSRVTGDQRIGALLMRSDGILFSGNGSGTVFSYESKAPDAATGGANGILGTSATLNATVNANNAATSVTFQYGTSTGYGSSVTATQSPLSGSTGTAASAPVSGLANTTVYHFRVVATNSAGTTYGDDNTFTTVKASATVSLGILAFTYDGTPKATTATTSPLGKTVVITYNGSTTPPTAAGSYTVAATVNDTDYQGTATGTLVIAKATATVAITPASLSATYGGTPKAAAATTTPSSLAVVFTYTGTSGTVYGPSPSAPSATGSYTVAAVINDANYQGSASGTLVIAVAGQSNQTITFDPAPTVVVGGFATVSATASSGLAVSFTSATPGVCTVDGAKVTGVGAGACTINATQAGNANYSAVSASQSLTVTSSGTPPALIVSALSDGAVTSETTLNISGTATDPSGIASVSVNGAAVQVSTGGSFSYPVQLVAGANTITVSAANNAGVSATVIRTIILDSTAPKLTVAYPPDNSVAIQQFITVTGSIAGLFGTGTTTAKAVAATAGPAPVVTWSINGSDPQSANITGTVYSFTANLVTGMNTIRISATNDAGQKVDVKRTVTWQPAFSLAVTDPESDIRTPMGSYTLTGAVADNTTPVSVTITMDGQNYTPTVTNGVFKQQLSFSDAKVYQVAVTGIDRNNNSLTVQRNVIHTALGATSSFTISDALLALRIAAGIVTPDNGQILRMDVAPMVNGVSVGDGKIDIEDVIVILRMAVGLI